MGRKRSSGPALDAALRAVEQLDGVGLHARWQALYGAPAPTGFRVALLRAGVAYKLQERALGGLKPGTRTLLRRVAEQVEAQRRRRAASGAPQTGPAAAPAPASADAGLPIPARSGRLAAVRQPATRIKPGTRLLRTWQGTTHEVLVGEDHVTYRGQRYRSLSEVARLITGQRWSGPLFFGLRTRAPEPGAAPTRPATAPATAPATVVRR